LDTPSYVMCKLDNEILSSSRVTFLVSEGKLI